MDLFLHFASCMNNNAGVIIIACVAAVAAISLFSVLAKLNRKHHFIVWDSVDDNYYLD